MKITSLWAVTAFVLLSLSQGAMAQDSKIGYINTQRITNESAIAKAAQAKLEQEFSKRGKELDDLKTALKNFSERYERDAPTLTESQRATRQREGNELTRDFQRKQREYQEDMNGRRNEELQQVLEKANKAVRKVAEDEKYDLVIQEVVYSNSRHDITDKVLKILNTGK